MNNITTNGHVTIHCPFCQTDTKHEVNFKCYGFNTAVQKQDVHFYKTCLHCDWIKSQLTVILKEDWEKLKVAT